MFGLFKKKSKMIIPLEDQLQTFSNLGITLNSDIDPILLLEEFSKERYEKDPYQLLLISMGGEIYKNDEFYIISNHIWHLDTECIEDHGDYIRIIERLMKLTNMNLQNIQDFVDIENETAWVSFEYNNTKIKWDLENDNDWLDPKLFDKFIELCGDRSNKKLAIASLGQDCLIGYFNERQLRELNKLVKYKFK